MVGALLVDAEQLRRPFEHDTRFAEHVLEHPLGDVRLEEEARLTALDAHAAGLLRSFRTRRKNSPVSPLMTSGPRGPVSVLESPPLTMPPTLVPGSSSRTRRPARAAATAAVTPAGVAPKTATSTRSAVEPFS